MKRGRGSNNYRNRGGNSSRPRTTQPRGLFADGVWHCDCTPRLPAEHFQVKKDSPNKGRWFYTCQQIEPKRCGFFLWAEDAKVREEGAVLSGSRTEAGRGTTGASHVKKEGGEAEGGKGLFARQEQHAGFERDEESTASPSPPPERLERSTANRTKRKAFDAELDTSYVLDSFGLSTKDTEALARVADSNAFETPHKAQKTGVYATPATTGKRKLPWLEQPSTPRTTLAQIGEYFETPSKPPASSQYSDVTAAADDELDAPFAHATGAKPVPGSSSPPTRHKDALADPADSNSSLASEVLTALSTTKLPPETYGKVRSILSKHDLKTQGVVKGREIARLALKAKDAKIAELQARIASLEAEREVERGLHRFKRWESTGKG